MRPPTRHAAHSLASALALSTASTLGCSSPPGGLSSPVPSERLSAAAAAARDQRTSAVPELIPLLSSDDPAVRLAAIRALEKLTGQTLGYRHYDPDSLRAQAIERWRDWSRSNTGQPSTPDPRAASVR